MNRDLLQGFDTQANSMLAMVPTDPAAIAAAEAVKARIQSAYIMALHKPRNVDEARAKILRACKRPGFAERVEFAKPVGKTKVRGPSIRFAELALREWENILTETQVVYEDDTLRRIKVLVTDLESNSTHSKEIVINKVVERKNPEGREVIGERMNTRGEKIFLVKATEDELHNKEAAQVSKAIRNEGLRLIPSDIIDEAIETARSTLRNRDARDPDAAKKAIVDAFSELNVGPRDLEEYLAHKLDLVSPAELEELRGIYRAIRDGEAKWIDYVKDQGERDDKPEPQEPEEDATFYQLVDEKIDESDHAFLAEFIKEAATANNVSEERVKAEAIKHFDAFLETFKRWKEKQSTVRPEQEETPDPWVEFRKEWINLRSGYEEYVSKNLDRFREAPPHIRVEAKRKWRRIFKGEKPWPLDEVREEPANEKSPETSEPPQESKIETVLDDRPTISCPKEGGDEVLIEYCNNTCHYKETCEAYKEYYEKTWEPSE